MDMQTARSILDGYAEWWRSEFSLARANDGVEIISPMLDRHNDHISIFLADDGEVPGGYVLTDMGATLGDLALSGCDVAGTEARRQKLDSLVGGFGLERSGNEIFSRTGEEGLFRSINFMMQGLAAIDDLFFTTRGDARGLFHEDVESWLDMNGIRYSPNISIYGRSGFESRFDFVIPKSGESAPERFIRVISHPSQQSVANSLFGWNDISEARENSHLYLFMDASNARSGKIGAELVNACVRYDVHPVSWDEGASQEVCRALAS